MAKQLRTDAAEQVLGRIYESRLTEAAFGYEKLAELLKERKGALLVRRQPQADARLKGFVLELANFTTRLCGNPLCGCLAITAAVVFCRSDMTPNTVRKMLVHAPRP
jgi:hypothetical protein